MLEIVGETLAAGAVVGGAYRLERVLGQGGMGVVWQGVELATGRPVALKFLQEKREADSRNQERVLREARATMGIVHPNVAAVRAVLETDAGIPFLVMDLLVGETLRARLQRQGPLNPVQCARIMRAVVSAVAAAHARHIVHRDLKPDNVFLVREPPDDVRVIDFGIAKHLDHVGDASAERDVPAKPSLTSTGAVLGTPVYMAPEQIFGDADIDGRADVWSLGIMLYELLAGRRPTDGEGFGRIIRRITTDPIEPLDHARPGLPHRLTSLVGKMLSRDRNQRPSLEEIGAVLESLESRDMNAPPSFQPASAPPVRVTTTASNVALGHPSTAIRASSPTGVAFAWIGGVLGIALLVGGVGFTAWRLRGDSVTIAPTTTASPTASAAPSTTTTTNGGPNADQEPTHLMMAAVNAYKARDGATCLRNLDAFDASPFRGAMPSSKDLDGPSSTRGMCLMLVGDCVQGKAMYKAFLEKTLKGNPQATPDSLEFSLDNVVGSYCEAANLSPHDSLIRASVRMNEAGVGLRKATSADCKEWAATETALLPNAVAAGSSKQAVAAMQTNLVSETVRCYAHVGDCKSALATFRPDFFAKFPIEGESPANGERRMTENFDANVDGTACKGTR